MQTVRYDGPFRLISFLLTALQRIPLSISLSLSLSFSFSFPCFSPAESVKTEGSGQPWRLGSHRRAFSLSLADILYVRFTEMMVAVGSADRTRRGINRSRSAKVSNSLASVGEPRGGRWALTASRLLTQICLARRVNDSRDLIDTPASAAIRQTCVSDASGGGRRYFGIKRIRRKVIDIVIVRAQLAARQAAEGNDTLHAARARFLENSARLEISARNNVAGVIAARCGAIKMIPRAKG